MKPVNTRKLTDAEYIDLLKSRSAFDSPKGCWLYQGCQNEKGYCQVIYRGERWQLTRIVHTLLKGPIAEGLLVCHHCDVPNCWNPEHLYAGTPLRNMLDVVDRFRHHYQIRDCCKNGHPFVEGSYYLTGPTKSTRSCILCNRISQRIRAGWPRELAETLPPLKLCRTYKQWQEMQNSGGMDRTQESSDAAENA